jgi:alpha-1,6-mannosyltransferase
MTDRAPLRWLGWLGASLLVLTSCGLLLDLPATTGELHIVRLRLLLGLLAAAAVAYFAAVRLFLRQAWPRNTVWIVIGAAVALRAVLLTAPPILSTDIYRYVWDGRVQAAGINPYRYIPADPALTSLRDPIA